jgi:hypothetical protein
VSQQHLFNLLRGYAFRKEKGLPTGMNDSPVQIAGTATETGSNLESTAMPSSSGHKHWNRQPPTLIDLMKRVGVQEKELRHGLPERVLALHARSQEILANANFFHGGDLGWTYGPADQGFRENQRMELTERAI